MYIYIYPGVNRIQDFDAKYLYDQETIWDMRFSHLYNPIIYLNNVI